MDVVMAYDRNQDRVSHIRNDNAIVISKNDTHIRIEDVTKHDFEEICKSMDSGMLTCFEAVSVYFNSSNSHLNVLNNSNDRIEIGKIRCLLTTNCKSCSKATLIADGEKESSQCLNCGHSYKITEKYCKVCEKISKHISDNFGRSYDCSICLKRKSIPT